MIRSRSNSPEFWLVALAGLIIIVAAALTLRVNTPINNQLMTWDPASPPANWQSIWARWEHVHTIRTILWLCAFALESLALTFFSSRASAIIRN